VSSTPYLAVGESAFHDDEHHGVLVLPHSDLVDELLLPHGELVSDVLHSNLEQVPLGLHVNESGLVKLLLDINLALNFLSRDRVPVPGFLVNDSVRADVYFSPTPTFPKTFFSTPTSRVALVM
jgi:hypothetical protein